MEIVGLIKRCVPRRIKTELKRYIRRERLKRYLNQFPPIKKCDLISAFQRLGLKTGDVVMVHSSLSSLGFVQGSADTVIDALSEAIGQRGTLMMPAYPFSESMSAYLLSKPVFDPATTPSRTGTITETFRKRAGVKRSLHPTHSVIALGPLADYLLENHEMSMTPCGDPSPFLKLIDVNGLIMCLGCPFGKITFGHVLEDRAPDFPVRVYLEHPAEAHIIKDGVIQKVRVMVHDPKLATKRFDNNKDKEREIFSYCLQRGIVRTETVGIGQAILVRAREYEELLKGLLARGITVYG